MHDGFVPDVREILEGIDALVMPSLWEAYGLIAAEALLVGCPVIVSDCVGLWEVTRDTPALTVRLKNVKSLADDMRRYIDKPGAVKMEPGKYLPKAMESYESRKTVTKLDDLFDEAISRRVGR